MISQCIHVAARGTEINNREQHHGIRAAAFAIGRLRPVTTDSCRLIIAAGGDRQQPANSCHSCGDFYRPKAAGHQHQYRGLSPITLEFTRGFISQ